MDFDRKSSSVVATRSKKRGGLAIAMLVMEKSRRHAVKDFETDAI